MAISPIIALAKGVASRIPGFESISSTRATGGTISSRYCYSVWLRHLTALDSVGAPTSFESVGELGPGDSIGIGMCALLSGAQRYAALDAVNYARSYRNTLIFDELCKLFKERVSIPGESEFPQIKPIPESFEFPFSVLPDQRLQKALDPDRVSAIRRLVSGGSPARSEGLAISYRAPWNNIETLPEASLDYCFSQAVLEHVDDIPLLYRCLRTWLKKGAFMLHQIDFRSHGTSAKWNGHWAFPEWYWKVLRGHRPYLLNRISCSEHVTLQEKSGFTIVQVIPHLSPSAISQECLNPRFKNRPEEDLTTSGATIISRNS